MKKLTTRDLFVSHIIRTMALRHIYIKLCLTEDGTVISFGSDEPADDGILPDSIGSQLVFDGEDDEFWSETVDLEELRDTILGLYPEIVLTLSEDGKKLMIEAKLEVPVPEESAEHRHTAQEVIDYLNNHKRTILISGDRDRGDYDSGYIATQAYGLYKELNKHFSELSEQYTVALTEIQSLNRSKFDVYCLYQAKGYYVVYEITNKLL